MTSEVLSHPESHIAQIVIVPRAAIPAIHSIEQQGMIHQLGELRDFQWHETLKDFMPPSNEFSIGWVCLQAGETLPEHVHPIQSMMIFYQGSGQMLGQKPQIIQAGDIVVVPPECQHGFIGGEKGLYALSIQFGPGLYTNPKNPRVMFQEEQKQINILQQYHQKRLQKILEKPFFKLFSNHTFDNSEKLQKLLDCMAIWEDHLQTPLYARYDSYKTVQDYFFDPVFEALIDWIPYQMHVLDHAEKYLIRNWIIADLGDCYHEIARSYLEKEIYDRYFIRHLRIEKHDQVINEAVLQHLKSSVYHRLKKILILSWNHFSALIDRMYELIENC